MCPGVSSLSGLSLPPRRKIGGEGFSSIPGNFGFSGTAQVIRKKG